MENDLFFKKTMNLEKLERSHYVVWVYSRTSVPRTLMARLPWLFRTRSSVPWKKSHRYRFRII